jgi:hypothetical protein
MIHINIKFIQTFIIIAIRQMWWKSITIQLVSFSGICWQPSTKKRRRKRKKVKVKKKKEEKIYSMSL